MQRDSIKQQQLVPLLNDEDGIAPLRLHRCCSTLLMQSTWCSPTQSDKPGFVRSSIVITVGFALPSLLAVTVGSALILIKKTRTSPTSIYGGQVLASAGAANSSGCPARLITTRYAEFFA